MKSTPATYVFALLLLGAPAASVMAATAPPPGDQAAFEPAPVPNDDVDAPTVRASEDPRIEPNFFKNSTQFRGDGFSPGSTSQGYEERRALPGYGVDFAVPLK